MAWSVPHIFYIVREHKATLEKLYARAISGEIEADATAVAYELADEFSPIVGRVIACGMWRPDLSEKMSKLPMAAQIDALEKIIRLTLEQEGGLEKTVEIVTQALVRANNSLRQKT